MMTMLWLVSMESARKRPTIACTITVLPTACTCVFKMWQTGTNYCSIMWSSYSTWFSSSGFGRGEWIFLKVWSKISPCQMVSLLCLPVQREGLFAALPSTASWRTTRSLMSMTEVTQQRHDEYAVEENGLLMQMKTFDTLFIGSLRIWTSHLWSSFSQTFRQRTQLLQKELEMFSSSECGTPHWG